MWPIPGDCKTIDLREVAGLSSRSVKKGGSCGEAEILRGTPRHRGVCFHELVTAGDSLELVTNAIPLFTENFLYFFVQGLYPL